MGSGKTVNMTVNSNVLYVMARKQHASVRKQDTTAKAIKAVNILVKIKAVPKYELYITSF